MAGIWDWVGDGIEVALPAVGTLFGPGGRALGGALGNLIDDAIDGDIHSFQDGVVAFAMGGLQSVVGGAVAGKLAGLTKRIPAVSNRMTFDPPKKPIKLGFGSAHGASLGPRAKAISKRPVEIGKGVGAVAGPQVWDIIQGDSVPEPPMRQPAAGRLLPVWPADNIK